MVQQPRPFLPESCDDERQQYQRQQAGRQVGVEAKPGEQTGEGPPDEGVKGWRGDRVRGWQVLLFLCVSASLHLCVRTPCPPERGPEQRLDEDEKRKSNAVAGEDLTPEEAKNDRPAPQSEGTAMLDAQPGRDFPGQPDQRRCQQRTTERRHSPDCPHRQSVGPVQQSHQPDVQPFPALIPGEKDGPLTDGYVRKFPSVQPVEGFVVKETRRQVVQPVETHHKSESGQHEKDRPSQTADPFPTSCFFVCLRG